MLRALSLLLSISLLCTTARAQQTPVRIQFDPQAPSTPIPSNFLGLSFETLTLLSHDDGEWRGTWQPVPSSGHSLQLKVPSGSAIFLKIEK